MSHLQLRSPQLRSVRYTAQKWLESYFLTLLALIQICLRGELSCKRIEGGVVGIERFVLPGCADRVCLTSQICLGETPYERSQEFIRSTARSVRQPERSSILRGVGVLGRALGGGDRGQGRLLLAVVLCPAI